MIAVGRPPRLLHIGLLFGGLPMPRPIPLPSNQPVVSRTSSSAVVAPRRWAPNIPGTLIRALSQRLGVDGIAAMRIALLYGDIEWQAAPASELRYSARSFPSCWTSTSWCKTSAFALQHSFE